MTQGRWEDREEAVERIVTAHTKSIVSAGLLVHQDDDILIVCSSLNADDGDVAQCISIPRVLLRRMDMWHALEDPR